MILVIDTSVASKWFLRFRSGEDDVPRALSILDQAVSGRLHVLQSPHFYAEMGAVLAREKAGTAEADLSDLLLLGFAVAETPEIYATALALSMRFDHHLFDTLYHAVALQTPGTVLITADRRYFAKARQEGRIQLLSELANDFAASREILP